MVSVVSRYCTVVSAVSRYCTVVSAVSRYCTVVSAEYLDSYCTAVRGISIIAVSAQTGTDGL